MHLRKLLGVFLVVSVLSAGCAAEIDAGLPEAGATYTTRCEFWEGVAFGFADVFLATFNDLATAAQWIADAIGAPADAVQQIADLIEDAPMMALRMIFGSLTNLYYGLRDVWDALVAGDNCDRGIYLGRFAAERVIDLISRGLGNAMRANRLGQALGLAPAPGGPIPKHPDVGPGNRRIRDGWDPSMIPPHLRNDPRFGDPANPRFDPAALNAPLDPNVNHFGADLCFDPAPRAATNVSIREAASALQAEADGRLQGPVIRSYQRENDYFDGAGRPIDVKTPMEQDPARPLDPDEVALSMWRQLDGTTWSPITGNDEPNNVLYDTSWIDQAQYEAIRASFDQLADLHGINPDHLRQRVIEVNVPYLPAPGP